MKHFISLLMMCMSFVLIGQDNTPHQLYCPEPVFPGPAKYIEDQQQWQTITPWGFVPTADYLHPDSMDATPVVFGKKLWVLQYSENNLTLYAREMYLHNKCLWVGQTKSIPLVYKGGTMAAIETVEEYYKLGAMSYPEFCKHHDTRPIPVVKQYYENCREFYNFFK